MVWMTKSKDIGGVNWRRDEERRARVITYLNLSLRIVLRDWKVEGSSEVLGQGGSEDTMKDFHVSGDWQRRHWFSKQLDLAESSVCLPSSESATAVKSEPGEGLS